MFCFPSSVASISEFIFWRATARAGESGIVGRYGYYDAKIMAGTKEQAVGRVGIMFQQYQILYTSFGSPDGFGLVWSFWLT